MSKPTYYLWKNEFQTTQEFEDTKTKYSNLGFRIVTFQDGKSDKDISEGLKAVIKNHYEN